MGRPAIGTVVLVFFPYSDFSQIKRRPALVVAHAEFNNVILCQITSKAVVSETALVINSTDFLTGGLPVASQARPDKLTTADLSLIIEALGKLKPVKVRQIRRHIRQLFT